MKQTHNCQNKGEHFQHERGVSFLSCIRSYKVKKDWTSTRIGVAKRMLITILAQAASHCMGKPYRPIKLPTNSHPGTTLNFQLQAVSREDCWSKSYCFQVPTGYMLFRISFINLRYIPWINSWMIGNFPDVLNFDRLLLKLNRFICN